MTALVLSPPVIKALDVAVHNAFVEAVGSVCDEARFIAPTFTIQDVVPAILSVVHHSLAVIVAGHNDKTSHTHRLPPELLCSIFDFLNIRDCISASHVCRTWRTTMLTCAPVIWSGVSCYQMPEGALSTLLERSSSADLKLEIKAQEKNWKEVSRCIEQHIHRCTYLKVVLSDQLSNEASDAVTAALCHPAPRLRTFKLFDHLAQFNRNRHENLLVFAGQAPRLDLVKLHSNIGSFPPSDALRAVKRLLYSNTGDANIINIQDVVERFSALDGFAIELDGWTDVTEDLKLISLPEKLRYFAVISNQSAIDPGSLLRYTRTSPVKHVTISYNKPASDTESAAVLARLADNARVTTMRVEHSAYSDALNVDVWYDERAGADAERQRSVLDLPHGARPGPSFFTHLTSFSVGENMLCMGEPFPPAPSLLTLTILLLQRAYIDDQGQNSIFLLPRTRDWTFTCPMLTALRIVGPPRDGTTRVAPEVLREFIDLHLEFECTKLSRFILRNVEIYDMCLDEVALLLDVADKFVVEDTRAVPGSPSRYIYNPLLSWQ